MNQLAATARNLITCHYADGGTAVFVESVIICATSEFSFDDTGKLKKGSTPRQLRFSATAAQLRTLAADLLEWADAADEIDRKSPKPQEEKP